MSSPRIAYDITPVDTRRSMLQHRFVQWATFCLLACGIANPALSRPSERSASMSADSVPTRLIYVHAEWCGPCKQIERDVLSDPDVRTLIDSRYRFQSVDWDSDAGANVRRSYGIEGPPVFLFVDAKGVELSRVVGIRSRAEFQRIFESGGVDDPLMEQLRKKLSN